MYIQVLAIHFTGKKVIKKTQQFLTNVQDKKKSWNK